MPRLSFFVPAIIFVCFVASVAISQIVKREHGSSWTGLDTVRSKDKLPTAIFYVQRNNTLDTLDIALWLMNGGFKGKRNEESWRKVETTINKRNKQQRTDSIIIVVNKSILANDSDYFSYKVLRDEEELLPEWQKVDFSDVNRIAGNWYALVKGKARGHKYVVDIRDRKHAAFELITTANGYPAMKLWGIYRADQKPQIVHVLDSCRKVNSSTIFLFPKMDWDKYQIMSPFEMFHFDSGTLRLPTSLNISSANNHLLFLMGDIPDTMAYEYRLVSEDMEADTGTVFSQGRLWTKNPSGVNLIELKDIGPGYYSLRIRYAHRHNTQDLFAKQDLAAGQMFYYITIRPQWYQTTWFYLLQGVLCGVVAVLAMFFIYQRYRRRKQQEAELERRMSMLQLRSYRAQLNPHFIFNALSSIQSLVNRNESALANTYLTDFSALLRTTLDNHDAEFRTLQDELEMLNKYISLERLRFGFQYDLVVDGTLKSAEVSFPSMLLQPIVENAIKHGISARNEEGILQIKCCTEKGNIIIKIADNGEGFDVNKQPARMHGICLTRERILFLNEINKGQRITLDIRSSADGTEAIFYLYDYL